MKLWHFSRAGSRGIRVTAGIHGSSMSKLELLFAVSATLLWLFMDVYRLKFRVIPVVLGTKPNPGKGYSAVALNEDRIVVIKKGASSDDYIWFLEVATLYVEGQKQVLGTEVVA